MRKFSGNFVPLVGNYFVLSGNYVLIRMTLTPSLTLTLSLLLFTSLHVLILPLITPLTPTLTLTLSLLLITSLHVSSSPLICPPYSYTMQLYNTLHFTYVHLVKAIALLRLRCIHCLPYPNPTHCTSLFGFLYFTSLKIAHPMPSL